MTQRTAWQTGQTLARFRNKSHATVLALLADTAPLAASDYHIWDGSSSGYWNVAANWTDNIAPVSGDILIFPPAVARLATTNNYPAGTEFALVFVGTNYVARGNRINLPATADPGIVATNSAGNNTVALDVALPRAMSKTISCLRAGGTLTLSGVMSGGLRTGLAKDGPGTLTLSGTAANTLVGSTHVQHGTLVMNKSSGGAVASLAVAGGAMARLLADNQIVYGVTVDSGGLLDLNNQSDAVTAVTLNGGTLNGYDQMRVSTAVNLGGAALKVRTGIPMVAGYQFTVLENNSVGAVTGTFAGLPNNATFAVANGTMRVNYDGGTGNDVVLTVTAASPVAPLDIVSCTPAAGQVWLQWQGGWPLFTVERCTNLTLGGWQTVMAPAAVSNFSHAISGPVGFYRVRSGN